MSALKRFTYDWLIRFMELTLENASHISFDNKTLKIAAVSPIFNRCANKYAPYYISSRVLQTDWIPEMEAGENKRMCVLTGSLDLCCIKQIIDIMHPRVYLYLDALYVTEIDNLELSHFNRILTTPVKHIWLTDSCKFATPVLFSELWPLINQSEDVILAVKNVQYDANMKNVMAKGKPCNRLADLQLYGVPASEDVVYPIVDHYLATTTRLNGVIALNFQDKGAVAVLTRIKEVLQQKILVAGFIIRAGGYLVSEGEIRFVMDSDSWAL